MKNFFLLICADGLRLKNYKIIRLKVLGLMILSLMILPLIPGCGGNSARLDKIVIGIDDEFAPMGFRNEKNEIVGFDVDLAKEAGRRMDVQIEFKPIDWDNKEFEITSGNIDMIWNGCDIMPEYKEYMIFSRPYMDNRQILLVRKDNPKNIHSVGDLAGKIVGTQSGSNSETYINQNSGLKKSFAEFKTYRNIKEGFDALNKGEFDVLIIDEIAGRYELSRHPGTMEVIEATVGSVTEFGIGFRKDNTDLRDRVQKVFDEMITDGTAKKISEQWFNADLIKSRR